MSYQILTVEETAGGLALKRRDFGNMLMDSASPVLHTAAGNPAQFSDGSDGRAVKELTAQIDPVQAGSGDPSPTNIRAITGRTGAVFTRTDGDGGNSSAASVDWTDFGTVYAGEVDAVGGKVKSAAVMRTLTGQESWTLVGSGNSIYFRMSIASSAGTYKENVGVCSHLVRRTVSSSNTEPGFNFYYSGSSFRLTMRPGVSGVSTVAQFKAWLTAQYNSETPVQVLYYRVTPEESDAAAASLTTLGGVNRISADVGPVSVIYTADTQKYIDEGLAADRAMIADAAPGFIAGRNFTAGEFLTVGDTLYRVTANIASGGDVVPGVNVTETTVGEEIAAVPAVDDTLTQSGDAADAKVTGDNLSEVKSAARAGGWLLPQPTTMQAWSWDSGTFSGTTGEDTSNSARLSTLDFVWPGKGLYGAAAAENYEFSVFAWSRADNSFVGRYTTDEEFSNASGATVKWFAEFDFTPWPDYKFKIVLRHSDDPTASMTLSLGSKCSFTAHKWMVNDRITRAAIAPTVYKSMGGYVTDRAYNAGDFMMTDDGKLLKATASIAAEDFVGSSNSVETTIGEQLALLWAAING